jgi:hypothetical protein
MIRHSSRVSRVFAGAVLCALPVLALGCSSSSKSGSSNPTTNSTATQAAAGDASSAAAVSGTWSGQYSGSFSGTFELTWQQSGSNLTGTIKISSLGNKPTPINGSLHGNNISFGTVGSEALTYTGTVSGSTMSGDWKLQAPNSSAAASGSWNASKSSS